MSKKSFPKEKKVDKKNEKTNKIEEEIFHQETDLDMKLSIERRKKGLPDHGLKTPDDYNEDHTMDRNVL
ncbi:hypothetical protein [Pinibacter soli]|uniref:Uncharacterized protein n=1 Tax=Pinibacter soli TaxID=3044211 RepID=A0ABT6RCY9_9BACT|nr:hypothetical protein [Pinibacter soli]MDI3320441.1 hypothetical protein [Pinibacter soli]